MICRSCLEELLQKKTVVSAGIFKWLQGWLLALGGYFLAVYVFYQIGRILLKIPSKFHQGVFFE
jgi:hypothetical protein